MWWSRRQILSLPLLAGSLAACAPGGYSPMLATGSPGAALRNGSLQVAEPRTENDYAFVARIEERLGRAGRAPKWQLTYSLQVNEDPVGVRSNQTTQRYNVIGRLDFQVLDLSGGTVLTSGGFESFTSYSATGGAVSGLAARDDAHARLMVLLADQLITRLGASAGAWMPASKAPATKASLAPGRAGASVQPGQPAPGSPGPGLRSGG